MTNSGPNGTWLKNDLSGLKLPVTGWTVYYSDVTLSGGTVASWEAAPAHDVQVVVYHHPNRYRTISSACDEYCYPGTPVTKLGRELPTLEEFKAILRKAQEDARG